MLSDARSSPVLVELSQYTFLLRVVVLVLLAVDATSQSSPAALAVLGTAYVVAVGGALTWRRLLTVVAAHPLLVALDVLLALAGLAVLGTSGPWYVLTLATALLAGLLYPAAAAALLSLILAGGYVLVAVHASSSPVGGPASAAGLGQVLSRAAVYVVLTASAGVVARRVRRLEDDAARHGLRAAQLEERSRLAREMHDSVVKTLHGLALAASGLARSGQPVQPARLARFAEAAEQGAAEARRVLVDLRQDQVDRPLVTVLGELCSSWEAEHEVPVRFTVEGVADVDGEARYELIAATREALENVGRHADARTVLVDVRGDVERVRVEVRDDGRGFQPEQVEPAARRRGHFGLVSLRERMQRVGGRAEVRSTPGAGTDVVLEVPQPQRGSRSPALARRGSRSPVLAHRGWGRHDG